MVKNLIIGLMLLWAIPLGAFWLKPAYRQTLMAEQQLNRGGEALYFEQTETAARHFKQAMTLRPAADLSARIGLTYHMQEHFAEGLPYLQQAFAKEPRQPWAMKVPLAAAYAASGDDKKGKAVMAEALKNLPDDPGIMNNLAYPMADGGVLVDETAIILEKAVKLAPKNWEIRDSLGWAYYRQGRLSEAQVMLSKALKIHFDEIVYQHLKQVNRELQAQIVAPKEH
jgi:Flp pilus assembly protein TadD